MMRELARDGAVYALGTIVSRGLGLLLLPLYTRVLPPEGYGLVDLVFTAGLLVNLVVPLETPQAVARLWNERAAGAPRRTLAGTGLLFALLGYAIFVLLAWLFAQRLAVAFSGRAEDDGAMRAGAIFIACNGLMLVLLGQFRCALRARAYALGSAAYPLLVLAGMVALVFERRVDAEHVLWMQAGAAALVALGCATTLRRDLEWRLDRRELRALLAFSLPLVPAGAAMFATVYLQRFVLNALATLEAVGLYAVGSRLAGAATLVLIGVQAALTPLVYAFHAEPATPAKLARLLEGFWGAALLACLALTVFARELIALLTVPAYAAAAALMPWLAPAALLAQMYIFAPGIPLAKKTGWQLVITLASGALGLLLALLLVPRWGETGAAVATLLASAAFFGGWLAAGQRLYPLPLRWAPLAAASALFVAAAAAATGLAAWPPGPRAWAAAMALLIAFAWALWRLGLLRRPIWSRAAPRAGA